MYKDKYFKYKNKYLNLLENKKNMKGGKVCTSSDEVFKSDISLLFKNLLNSARSFLIPPNSRMFRSKHFFTNGNDIHVSKNIMTSLLSELEADYSRDPSFSAKSSMVNHVIRNFKNLKKCFNKEFTDEDLLVAVNFEDNINGSKIGIPSVKFKRIEDVTIEYYEKLLWWGCNINCNSMDTTSLIPKPSLYSPTPSLYSPTPSKLPNLNIDCWKEITSSNVEEYNIDIAKYHNDYKIIGSVKRYHKVFCSKNYPYYLFLKTKDEDMRTGKIRLSKLIYRDMSYLKKYGENTCSIFPKHINAGSSAQKIFNDGLKSECKNLGNLSPYSLSPTNSSIPSFIPNNIFTLSPTIPLDNYLITPNNTSVFENNFRPKTLNYENTIPNYSNNTYNPDSEDSIDIDWNKFNEELKNESDTEEYIEKKATKKKVTKKKVTKKKVTKKKVTKKKATKKKVTKKKAPKKKAPKKKVTKKKASKKN